MSRSSAHLRGDVVRRATEGGGGHSVHDALFAHAEVCQLTVSLCVQQDVIQLQIPGTQRWSEKHISLHFEKQFMEKHVYESFSRLPVDDSVAVQEHEG